MEASNTLNEFVERIRSWIPRKVEAPASTMSRAFWIPDRSCLRCYECESQFTIFNRRHHCRLCGKVFCGKCSLNTLPASVDGLQGVQSEEGERVRVCNYCYKHVKQREREQASILDGLTPTLSPSSSGRSLASSGIGAGAPVVPTIAPEETLSGGSSNRQLYPDAASPEKQYTMRNYQGGSWVHGSISCRARDQPPSPYALESNRSDDEYETEMYEGEMSHSRQNQQEDENEPELELDPRDNERKSSSSNYSSQGSIGPRSTVFDDGVDGLKRTGSSVDGKGEDDGETATISFYRPEGGDEVDYETKDDAFNPPPPAEDEEKKVEEVDEDEDDEEVVWGAASPGSASSLDLRKSSNAVPDEHRRAMRAQVDGHFRAFVGQLLHEEFVDVGEPGNPDSWLEIVSSLSWQAASYVKPDKGGGMDPGNYVKVKCIACGKPSDSVLVKGVVFRRNVAHRRMTSRLRGPKVLLLGGALEYQRVSNQLSSLDTLLDQEKEHLSMTVSRIESYRPNVLLVEKTVSRYAQDNLLDKDITLVLNVKKPVLDRIARCLGTQVVASPDLLPKVGQTGNCDLFHVEKYYEEHGSAGQQDKHNTKFLMFFEGCPKPQGCTILLKGANGDELKKVKHVMNLTVFGAYHLGLETSFLVDEGATFSELSARSPMSCSRVMSRLSPKAPVPGFAMLPPVQAQDPYHYKGERSREPKDVMRFEVTDLSVSPVLTRSVSSHAERSHTVSETGSKLVTFSAFDNGAPAAPVIIPPSPSSSCVSSATNSPGTSPAQTTFGFQPGMARGGTSGGASSAPYLHTANGVYPGRQSEQGVSGLSASLRNEANGVYPGRQSEQGVSGLSASLRKEGFPDGFDYGTSRNLKPSEVNVFSGNSGFSDRYPAVTQQPAGALVARDGGPFVERDFGGVEASGKQLRVDVSDSWQNEAEMSSEDFPPSDQGNRNKEIVVQLSCRCVKKRNVCKAPHFLRIQFYGNNDRPLGNFLRDQLFDASQKCRECDELVNSHVYCFTHRSGSLTISMRKIDGDILKGEKEGKIWMWHRCLKCPLIDGVPPPTHRVVMSDAAWGLSFGKFLELSFSNHEAASRVAACGHSLHRHFLRFYGFGSMVACFRYAEIKLNSVYLPPLQLEFSRPQQDKWLEKETEEVNLKMDILYCEVLNKLREAGEKAASSSSGTSVGTLDVRRRIKDMQEFLLKESTEFMEILDRACPSERSFGQSYPDILQLNILRRKLLNSASHWASRLHLLESSMPTKTRITGSIGEAGLSHLVAGRDPSGNEVIPSITAKPSDTRSSPISNIGSEPSEVATCREFSTRGESTFYRELRKEHDLERHGELADANGLDFRLENDRLTAVSADPEGCDDVPMYERRGRVGDGNLGNSTAEREYPVISASAPAQDSILATDRCPCAASEEPDRPVTEVPGILETDLASRRALSEGSYPLLADLSSMDTWTGELNADEKQKVKSCTEQVTDGGEANEDSVEDQLEGPQFLDGSTSGIGSQETGSASPEKVAAVDIQPSVPASPEKHKPDLSADEMSASINPTKTFSRTASNVSTSSSRWPSQGLTSPISVFVQQEGDPRFLEPGHDDMVVAVYDDEATSLIAYAIASKEHYAHVTDIPVEREKAKEREDRDTVERQNSEHTFHPLQSSVGAGESDTPYKGSTGFLEQAVARLEEMENPLTSTRTSQMVKKTITFWDDSPQRKARFSVVCYYAKQFDALRKKCCEGNIDYIRSLSRCKKWGAQGGKSNVFFAKTADDRFIVKQVTRTELNSFLDFAPHYFKYLCEALTAGNPTCLAKIFGVYEVKVMKGGKETKMDVLVMENLLFGRRISRLYDLKGSKRSRYNTDTSGSNQVLLDSNLLEGPPIFVGNKSKKILERAVWNDTNFLSLVFVMDYSLLVGVDEERKELVVGIIDFMRQYTWDKHLETWVKASGILGGPKDATPTVISPKQYKKRFRKAMATYFLMVPDDWLYTQSTMAPPVDLNAKGCSTKEDDVGEDSATARA